MADKQATFSVNLESNAQAVAQRSSASLDEMRRAIEGSQSAMRGLNAAQKAIRGSSDEAQGARKSLQAQLDAERGAVSSLNLALVKQGVTYEQLAQKEKAAAAAAAKATASKTAAETKAEAELKKLRGATGALTDGIKAGGGPVADLTGKIEGLKNVAAGGAGGLALVTLAATALVAGVVAVGAAVFEAGVKLGRFVLEGANALRSMNLMREAASGSSENARNLGTQVDALARKVSTSKVELNAMAVALTKSLSGGTSKASGQAIVDTFAAIAQGTAAAGDETGAKIREIIERGKAIGRISIDPRELQGSRLKFQEIAGALAKNLGVSLEEAREALFQGRVKLADGAKALRTVVEGKFGEINAKKLLDINVQFEKAHERLVGLTKGVVLEPLLRGMAKVLEKFDATSVTGQAIERIFTKVGNAIAGFAVGHIDDVVHGVEQLVIWGVKAADIFAEWAPKIAGVVSALANNEVVMTALKGVAIGLVVIVGTLGAAIGALGVVAGVVALAIAAPFQALWRGYQAIRGVDWGALGRNLIDGLVGGIVGGAGRVVGAVTGLASRVKDAFKDALGIHSPSVVFQQYGEQTGAGYREGVESSAPGAQSAADDLAPRPRGASGGGGAASAGSSAGGSAVIVNFMFPESIGQQKAHEIAKAVAEPSVLGPLTRAIRQALITQGIPTQEASG